MNLFRVSSDLEFFLWKDSFSTFYGFLYYVVNATLFEALGKLCDVDKVILYVWSLFF